MSDVEGDLTVIWADLVSALAEADPGLLGTLNPPADESDISLLLDAVWPLPIPTDLLEYLRLANGQDRWATWPTMACGPLLSTEEIISNYAENQTANGFAWSARWLPIAQLGWVRAAVELVVDRPAAVIYAEITDPPFVCAPSIAAMFRATAALARAGLVTPPAPPVDLENTRESGAIWMQESKEWRRRSRAFLSAFYADEGWGVDHVPVETPIPVGDWPAIWK